VSNERSIQFEEAPPNVAAIPPFPPRINALRALCGKASRTGGARPVRSLAISKNVSFRKWRSPLRGGMTVGGSARLLLLEVAAVETTPPQHWVNAQHGSLMHFAQRAQTMVTRERTV
jgi:hypothetical protein